MRIYYALYSRGTAAAVVIASWLILAAAQTAVVYGAMGALHPVWPWWLRLAAAAGYDLATLSVGLVLAVRAEDGRGVHPVLVAGLVFFVGVSAWLGFDAAMQTQLGKDYRFAALLAADPVQWVRALLVGAALPVQYLLAVAAGHQLAAAAPKASQNVRARSAAGPGWVRRQWRRAVHALRPVQSGASAGGAPVQPVHAPEPAPQPAPVHAPATPALGVLLDYLGANPSTTIQGAAAALRRGRNAVGADVRALKAAGHLTGQPGAWRVTEPEAT